MPRVSEIGPAQSQISGLLKAGLTQLSGDQHVDFYLYRKLVSPLDGMVYWTRVQQGTESATTVITGGLASKIAISGTSVQAVQGGVGAQDVVGGWIVNPATAEDQGLMTKMEPIHVSITGPASMFPDPWTTEVMPGERFEIPPAPEYGVWVSAPTRGHKFTVLVKKAIPPLSGQPLKISQSGSLHYASETSQLEDMVSDTNMVVFTSKDEIRPFNLIGPNELYVGERTIGVEGDSIQFAFSSRGNYYEAADLWHYMGQALNSPFRSQVIDEPADWEPDLIVSNSLPIWLSFAGYVPPYWDGLLCPFPVYPSFLAPDNAKLPYAAIHIDETRALQAVPRRGRHYEHDQQASDKVRITLHGASAKGAADFMDFALQYMRDAGYMGLMQTPPILRDEHSTQVEFRVLAQKKVLEFEVSYWQSVARDIARQLVKGAIVQFYPFGQETSSMPQITERLHRAVAMPIMTQAMKPPPVRPLVEPAEPPPTEGGDIQPRTLSAAASPRRRRKLKKGETK